MHAWLYNGDQLFPKQLNLCTRGRNALLDLDLGPGAAYDLGLFGPAWETHLFSMAMASSPRENPLQPGAMRFLYCWPVVSTAQFDRLREIHRLGSLAARSDWTWAHAPRLVRHLRMRTFAEHRQGRWNAAQLPPAQGRRLAREWAQQLKVAWLRRLAQSARVLLVQNPAAPAEGKPSAAPWELLVRRSLPFDEGGLQAIGRLEACLVAAARRRGLLFDSRRYRRFHDQHLVARVGPAGREARLGLDGLALLLRRTPRSRPLHARILQEIARIRFLREGVRLPELAAVERRVGRARLQRTRQQYLALRADLEAARARLGAFARQRFTAAVRARIRAHLARHPGPLLAGSFYFETEHLMETSSGFTHVGLVKRLPDPKTLHPMLWMFDRVIGFHYAYPVARLTHSVPVQLLTLPPEQRRRRAYRWIRMRVPRVFRFGQGRRSSHVSLINLFVHLRTRLRRCPRLAITPGFYYAAITWLIHYPANRRALADIWVSRRFTGYGYQSLSLARMQRLPGRVLYVPVRERLDVPWSPGCPGRERDFTSR